MYQPTFKDAPLWAVLWRSVLALFAISFLTGVVTELFNITSVTGISILSECILYFLFYKIVISQMNKHELSTAALSKPAPKSTRTFFKITGLTVLVAIVASTFAYFVLTVLSFMPDIFESFVYYLYDAPLEEDVSFLYIFVTAVIFAPLSEEIVFRGYLFNKWADKYGLRKGVWFSSLFFMAIHIQSLFIPQLLLGLLCATVYAKYKNLVYPILIHALYNFLVILPLLFAPEQSPMEAHLEMMDLMSLVNQLSLDVIIGALLFVGGLIGFFFFCKKEWRSLAGSLSPYAHNVQTEDTLPTMLTSFEDIEF